MIIPGYGMAVAQAQHIVYEITKALRAKGSMCASAFTRLPGACRDT